MIFLQFLNLGTDDSVTVDDVTIEGDKKIITISRKPSPTFCPVCDTWMNSRGIYTRVVKHPVLQDGMKVELIIKQRKWRCPACNFYQNEKLPFIERYSHKTHITVLMIFEAMKDLNSSTFPTQRSMTYSPPMWICQGFPCRSISLWMRSISTSTQSQDMHWCSWIS